IMRRMRNLAQIQLREKDENERLDKSHEQTQWHQQYRHQPIGYSGSQMCNRIHHLLVSKHVAEETNAQRKRTNEVTDELDRKDEWRNPPDWTGEVLQMSEQSVLFDADVVVINER